MRQHELNESKSVPRERTTIGIGWAVFWCIAFSATGYKLGAEEVRKQVRLDTMHVREVCLNLYPEPNRCIEDALQRMENK